MHRVLRRTSAAAVVAIAAIAAAGALALFSPAAAADYPNRSVRIIVPFAAGGTADIYARVLSQKLQQALGQTFVIDNRPGAGAIIGTDLAARSPADGYTLLLISNTQTVNETLFAKKPYQLMRDFEPVAPINYSDLVLVIKPAIGANNLQDLIKLAKDRPGTLSYASSGLGTPYHMAGELFKAMAGVSILHVPYKDSSGARTDLLGGQVDMMFDSVPTMRDFIRSGKVKAIATTGKVRSEIMPDVPTVSEAGVPGYEAVIWLGLMAPKNTPKAIVDRLNAEITKIVSKPEMRDLWKTQGAVAMAMTPAEFSKYLNDDIQKWARIIKISGATVN
jgi:tripartite-type tricarboxylate transporter receptor subunit TctC